MVARDRNTSATDADFPTLGANVDSETKDTHIHPERDHEISPPWEKQYSRLSQQQGNKQNSKISGESVVQNPSTKPPLEGTSEKIQQAQLQRLKAANKRYTDFLSKSIEDKVERLIDHHMMELSTTVANIVATQLAKTMKGPFSSNKIQNKLKELPPHKIASTNPPSQRPQQIRLLQPVMLNF